MPPIIATDGMASKVGWAGADVRESLFLVNDVINQAEQVGRNLKPSQADPLQPGGTGIGMA
jgi:hypothetical protein